MDKGIAQWRNCAVTCAMSLNCVNLSSDPGHGGLPL